ncbi:RER1-like_protein-retention of ER protein [Hexamita inflata]|uniref:RER1-like protein-retention of ER protein n=1 Tax=Hexamita inflata TaxID=28002 RepID=A0AA86R1D6_9EUKA|nr:RER1-like protein-retention of ER protein [Hexamita inflata]CAI9945345.1 RER1-like protein-retention of ER protein [Hexamita inflata]CAI9964038.1 RER1-like protein-retention of ER protein [Hexamita inflata]
MSDSVIDKVKYKVQEFNKYTESYTNRMVGQKTQRWAVAFLLTIIFILRLVFTKKYVSIAYFAYIYILSSFLQFISPKNKQDLAELPVSKSDVGEYKSYQRQLPEFDFWQSYIKTHVIAIFCSLMPFLDIPVYAPLLIIYCFILTGLFLMQEFEKWRSVSVNAKQAVKYWVGLDKPNYKK